MPASTPPSPAGLPLRGAPLPGRRRSSAGTAGRFALRLTAAAVVLWAVVTITFFAVRAVPGDPVQAILGGPGSNASAAAVAQARADYGLDLPLGQQYVNTLAKLLRGDLGTSYRLHEQVSTVIGELLPNTLVLAVTALVLAWLIALALGWWSMRGSAAGRAIAGFLGVAAASLPHFWLGALLITLLATGLGLPVAVSAPGIAGLILPAIVLAIPLAGYLAQVMRDGIVDALEQPFITAARARGESEWRVFRTRVLRRAALPAVSLSGWAFGSLVSGAVVVERLFSRPGLGRSLVDAVTARDVPMVTGVLIVVAVAFVLVTLVTDVIEDRLQPESEREAQR